MFAAMKSFLAVTLAFPMLALGCGGDDTAHGSGSTATTVSTTTGAGGAGGASVAVTTGAGGAGGATTATTTGAGGSENPDCENLPPGPITPELVIDVFSGSEDIAFDGKGHLAGKQGNTVVLVDANGTATDLATLSGTVYGVRYMVRGNLLAALPQAGKLVEITPAGVVTDYVTGVSGPNGIYPDFDGNVWVTEFGNGKVTRVNPDKTKDTLLSNLDAPNGIVLDASKTRLYFTEYQQGKVLRLDLQGAAAPVEIADIVGSAPDGLVMDVCGNLYAFDQGNSRLYRIRLDASGNPTGEPELLASFAKNVANGQFGSGPGFDPKTIYAAGTPGSVYAVPVGVAGAPVPTPL